MKKWKNELIELLSENFCLEENGHMVNRPEYYYNLGFPIEFTDQFIQDHQRGENIKDTIFTNGKPREITTGIIPNLEFLYGIADELEIKYNSNGAGRGSQAQDLVQLIKEKLIK